MESGCGNNNPEGVRKGIENGSARAGRTGPLERSKLKEDEWGAEK